MKDMTDEEIQESIDRIVAKMGPELELLKKKRRDKFLQESLEDMKKHGVPAERLPSDGWWDYIPDFDDTRNWLTGLYMSPPVNSKVAVCKDHEFVEDWMKAKRMVGVVLSVQPESTITLLDKKGKAILDRDDKEVRISGIPRVEVAFSEDDYAGGFYLPADCLKVLEYDDEGDDEGDEYYEDDEEAEYAEDDDLSTKGGEEED